MYTDGTASGLSPIKIYQSAGTVLLHAVDIVNSRAQPAIETYWDGPGTTVTIMMESSRLLQLGDAMAFKTVNNYTGGPTLSFRPYGNHFIYGGTVPKPVFEVDNQNSSGTLLFGFNIVEHTVDSAKNRVCNLPSSNWNLGASHGWLDNVASTVPATIAVNLMSTGPGLSALSGSGIADYRCD